MFRTRITKLRPLRLSGTYAAAAGAITLGLSSVSLTAVHLDNGERRRDLDGKQNRVPNTVVPERVSPGSAVDTSTFLVGSSSGVRRYDTARIASNRLCENTHSAAVLPVPSGSWSFFSITDGPSQRIHDNLITAVAGALADLWQLNSDESKAVPEPSIESIQHTLKKTFLELEADVKIVSPNSAIVAPFDSLPSSDARPGALLAFYDSHFRLLHIATTGSPCATLGRCMIGPDGFRTYTAHDLSHVQSEEAARLPASRSSKVVEGTSWALDPSVSSAFDTQVMRRKDIGPYPTDRLEIEVTSIKVQPGDFLILGSSGLWWLLDARTSVDLIGRWRGTESSFNMAMSLPDERSSHVQGTRPLTQDLVIGNKHPGLHLVRNALVTTDSDEMYDRDDITVTIVFFGDEETGGTF